MNSQQRGVAVIPSLLDDTPIATRLGHRNVVDLSRTWPFARSCKQAATRIEFSRLTGYDFERLVADLLQTLSVSESRLRPARESTSSIWQAIREVVDPFGVPEWETWLVECKLYRPRPCFQSTRFTHGQTARSWPRDSARALGIYCGNHFGCPRFSAMLSTTPAFV